MLRVSISMLALFWQWVFRFEKYLTLTQIENKELFRTGYKLLSWKNFIKAKDDAIILKTGYCMSKVWHLLDLYNRQNVF